MSTPTKFFIGLLTVFAMGLISSCYNPEKTQRNFSKQGIYELDMQVYMKELRFTATEDDNLIRQWRMNIPQSYIYQHRGVNGKPDYDPIKDKANRFSILLHAAIDTENNKVVEQAKIGRPNSSEKKVIISLLNGYPTQNLRESKECLTDQDKAKIMGRNAFVCQAKLCRVTMYVDGWPTHLLMDKELYEKNLQLYCDVTKDFLNQMTLKRESLIALDKN